MYSILSLLAIGAALTLGPVVYNTVERLQKLLVAFIFLFMLVLFFLVVDVVHVGEMARGIANVGHIPDGMELPLLLGALAFAGAGGTMNLAQGNYVREKGFAMGRFAGRLTSPPHGARRGGGRHRRPLRARRRQPAPVEGLVARRQPRAPAQLLPAVGAVLMMLSLIAYATTQGAPGLEKGFGFIRARGGSSATATGRGCSTPSTGWGSPSC